MCVYKLVNCEISKPRHICKI